MGLKADGPVVAVGYNGYGQCNVNDWRDIVSIYAGSANTVGLRKDGTVVAVGYNEYGQCEVSDWKDIVEVAANNDNTLGLKDDGGYTSELRSEFSKIVPAVIVFTISLLTSPFASLGSSNCSQIETFKPFASNLEI